MSASNNSASVPYTMLKSFLRHCAGGLVVILASSCATGNAPSVVSKLRLVESERKPLTKEPRQILPGTWIDNDGVELVLKAGGGLESPSSNVHGPDPASGIPPGMILVDGALYRGKAGWIYEGDSKKGTLKLFWENHEKGITGGNIAEVEFINDDKFVLVSAGSPSIVTRLKQ